MMKKLMLAAALATLFTGTVAHADDAKPDNDVSFNAAVTSDQPLQLLVTGYAGDASTLTPADASYRGEFTISAVPEPQNFELLLAGLGVAAAVAWRRRRPE